MSTSARWRRVEELCHSALECDTGARARFLTLACGDDEALRREVDALLAHAHTADRFLAEPIGLLAARVLTEEPPSLIGRDIGQYRILEQLGAGGMGVVYRAEDTKLKRSVALKFPPPAFTRDEAAKRRFMLEAQAASALEHINICTIYDIAEAPDGQLFLAMAFYAGETLQSKIARGPMPLQDALNYAIQTAEGLVKAHAAGIIHLDLKPANVLITDDGIVKIVDFGIAQLLGQTSTPPADTTFGTVAYMSPEQLAGSPVDARSDLWSLGVVLYELIAGVRPFKGDDSHVVEIGIAQADPEPLTRLRPDVPIKLERIVNRALAKNRDHRYQTAEEFATDLQNIQRECGAGSGARSARTIAGASALAVVVLAAVVLGAWRHRAARERWAFETATPEIARLVDADDFAKAAVLLREARGVLPHDTTLEKLWMRTTAEVSIATVPAGAVISIRPYSGDPNTWERLGRTPLKRLRIPNDDYVWRVTKPRFASISFIGKPPSTWSFRLHPEGSVPPEMVVVSGGVAALGHPLGDAPLVRLDDYLIDRHEVTNDEYQTFIDAGGYQHREFWKEPFVKDGRTIPWENAMRLLHDATGRPGPATWEAATFPKGEGEYPVSGVSWYEAAAYAAWAGKSLPTVYHWSRAAQTAYANLILPGSNLLGVATQPVGLRGALSGFGTTDMAGNVKEWCWNESWAGKRFILGGGYGDPSYMFAYTDAQSPWDRRANYGFRTVKLGGQPPAAALAKLEPVFRDYSKERPASDQVFRAFRDLYAYDKGELSARIEETEQSDDWTREKVTFNAAYGDERVTVHLFKPRTMASPLQSVIFHPGGGAYALPTFDPSAQFREYGLDFIIKSGRAVVFPILKGQYERTDGLGVGGKPRGKWRDRVIMQSKDMGRLLDYLETRKDFDRAKFAYFGFSAGGAMAPIHLAIERRFKTAILSSGGFWFRDPLPEVDAMNFAPRVKMPVLMLNGRYDNYFPPEFSQLPLFRLLGTPDNDKKYILYDAGHGALPRRELERETLDWLDKYLGPVHRHPPDELNIRR